jgi:adenylyltransferase/sulfurtransferase
MLCDGLSAEVRKIRVPADPGCPLCGDNPTIRDLSLHRRA